MGYSSISTNLATFYGMSPDGDALPSVRQLARSVLVSGISILLLLAIVAGVVQHTQGLGGFFVAKSIGFYLLGFLLLFAGLSSHLPLARFGAANQATLLRGSLVALLFGFLGEQTSQSMAWLVVAIGAICIALDGIDGWLARRHASASSLGARFDMETDALAILALSLLAWQLDKTGVWVLAAGALRYMFLAASFVFPWLEHELAPNRRRQTVCVVQVISLIACLTPTIAVPWSGLIAAVGLVLLVWSFSTDVYWLACQHYIPEGASHEI